jgi:hypothetical protein
MAVDAGTGHRPLSWFNSRPGLQFSSFFHLAAAAARKPKIQHRQRMVTPRQSRRAQPLAFMAAAADFVPCPKCRAGMTHVAVTPHPVAPGMQRNTFVCHNCNQTRTYMLPAAAAAAK